MRGLRANFYQRASYTAESTSSHSSCAQGKVQHCMSGHSEDTSRLPTYGRAHTARLGWCPSDGRVFLPAANVHEPPVAKRYFSCGPPERRSKFTANIPQYSLRSRFRLIARRGYGVGIKLHQVEHARRSFTRRTVNAKIFFAFRGKGEHHLPRGNRGKLHHARRFTNLTNCALIFFPFNLFRDSVKRAISANHPRPLCRQKKFIQHHGATQQIDHLGHILNQLANRPSIRSTNKRSLSAPASSPHPRLIQLFKGEIFALHQHVQVRMKSLCVRVIGHLHHHNATLHFPLPGDTPP